MHRRFFLGAAAALGVFSSSKVLAGRVVANGPLNGLQGGGAGSIFSLIKSGESVSALLRHESLHDGAYGAQRIPLLVLIAIHGSIGQMNDLLRHGVDVNAASTEGHTALKAALMRGSLRRAGILIEGGAIIGVPGRNTEIQAATIGGDEDCIDLMISMGQLPDFRAISTALRLRKYRVAESFWQLTGKSPKLLGEVRRVVGDSPELLVVIEGWK